MKDLSKLLVIAVKPSFERNIRVLKNELSEIVVFGLEKNKHPYLIQSYKIRTVFSENNKEEPEALPFYKVCNELERYSQFVWASWGDFERRQLERQTSVNDMPLNVSHINIKTLYSLKRGLLEELSVYEALALEEILIVKQETRTMTTALAASLILDKLIYK